MAKTGSAARYWPIALEHAAVLLGYLLLSIFMTYPLIALDGDTSLCPASNDLVVIYAWANHVESFFGSHPLDFFASLSPSIAHPLEHVGFFGDHGFGNVFLFAPFYYLVEHPLVAANYYMIFSYALAAYAMFLLAMHFLSNRPAALIAGLVFSLTGFRLTLFWDPQCIVAIWIVLTFLFTDKFLVTGKARYGFLASACVIAQMYFYVYFFVMLATFLVVYIALHPQRRTVVSRYRVTLGSLALVLLFSVPFVFIYLHVREFDFFLAGNLETRQPLCFSLDSLFRTFESNWLYGGFLRESAFVNMVGLPQTGFGIFPGITAVLLFVLGCFFLAKSERIPKLSFLLVGLASLVFAVRVGPTHFAFDWMSNHFYPFSLIRVPLRFMVFFQMTFALAVAIAIRWLANRLAARNAKLVFVVPLVLGCLIVLENMNVPFRTYDRSAYPYASAAAGSFPSKFEYGEATPLSKWLRDSGVVKAEDVVLELPAFLYPFGRNLNDHIRWRVNYLNGAHAMFQSFHHHRALADGWTGHLPKGFRPIEKFDLRITSVRQHLRAIGVDWIVVHEDWLGPDERGALGRHTLESLGLAPVATVGADRVYRFAEPVELVGTLESDVRFESHTAEIVFRVPGRDRDSRRVWLNPLTCRRQGMTVRAVDAAGKPSSVELEFVLPLTIREDFHFRLDDLLPGGFSSKELVAIDFAHEHIADWKRAP
jgi:hypothetical protein